jgi:large subunit ribosomal protein L25
VFYGGKKQIHFYSPMILFRELIYTQDAHFVHLIIEGEEFEAILQDIQFHPVSEIILHADFLQLFEDKKIKMNIPVKLFGQSPAVIEGGVLIHKRKKLSVLALPKDMPSHIDVDISNLLFHSSVKVEDIPEAIYEILDTKIASIAVVEMPRALKETSDVESVEETEEVADKTEEPAEEKEGKNK